MAPRIGLVVLLAGCMGEVGPAVTVAPVEPAADAGGTDAGSPDAGIDSGSPDAGTTDGGIDAGTTDAGSSTDGGAVLVPVLFAHGHFGRVDISCDNGRSWKHTSWYLSGDDAVCGNMSTTAACGTNDCFQRNPNGTCSAVACDCSHGYQIARGQASSPGTLLLNYGWGNISVEPVQTSRDGIHWKTTFISNAGSGAVSYGDGQFILHSWGPSYISNDDGATWLNSAMSVNNVPRQAIYSTVHQTHIVVANGTFFYSDDRGLTFKKPTSNPPCSPSLELGSSAESTSGTVVIWDGAGNVCRSSDGGKSWQATTLGPLQGQGVFNPKLGQFVTWGGGNRYTSSDGATWTTTALPAAVRLGPVAVAPNGDFVASNSDANATFTAYQNQQFYTSADGLVWTPIPAGNFVKSHPISTIRPGLVEGDAVCNPNYTLIHELRRDIDNGTVQTP
jgi:hypothetical protein